MAGDLTSVDYIAIGVSLALAVFILTFLILFYCLAQRRIVTIGRNRREKGRVSILVSQIAFQRQSVAFKKYYAHNTPDDSSRTFCRINISAVFSYFYPSLDIERTRN